MAEMIASHHAARTELSAANGTPNGLARPLPAAHVGAPAAAAIEEPGGFDPVTLLHAFRRNWPIALVAGIVLGGGAAAGVWQLFPPSFSAAAYVRIDSEEDQIAFRTADRGRTNSSTFKLYRATQTGLIRSPLVLAKAVARDDIASLPIVADGEGTLTWLQKCLETKFVGDSEVLRVEVTAPDERSAVKLTDAIVEAYMSEVVLAEKNERIQRLDTLERTHAKTVNEVRGRQNEMKILAETLGTDDPESLSIRKQAAMEQASMIRRQLGRVTYDILSLEGRLQVTLGLSGGGAPGTDLPAPVITDTRLDRALFADPEGAALIRRRSRLENTIARAESDMTPEAAAAVADRYRDDLAELEREIAARREEVREGILAGGVDQSGGGRGDASPAELRIRMGVLGEQKKLLEADLREANEEMKNLSRRSIDIEMMQAFISTQKNILANLDAEIEKTKVELKSGSRVEPISDARLEDNNSLKKRIAATAGAGLGGLFLPLAGLLLFDLRKKPVSDSGSLAGELGVSVLGTVPMVRNPTAIAREESAKGRGLKQLAESVDSIAAMLLSQTRLDGRRVMLVSSAVPGEGKTTLACNLWRSLAAAGKSVALVDLDLRRPSIEKELRLPRGPGVADVLLGNVPLEDAVRSVAEGRDVLTAGSAAVNILAGVTRESLPGMIDELRDRYDFVIIDGAPLIPVADSRVVSQFVDGAILSAIKDKSRMRQVVAAKDLLAAYGTPIQGVVVAGSDDQGYGYNYRRYGYGVRNEAAKNAEAVTA